MTNTAVRISSTDSTGFRHRWRKRLDTAGLIVGGASYALFAEIAAAGVWYGVANYTAYTQWAYAPFVLVGVVAIALVAWRRTRKFGIGFLVGGLLWPGVTYWAWTKYFAT